MGFFASLIEPTHQLEEAGAFAQFYENTHLNLYRYVMALCGGDVAQAEDVTAETYMRAWKNRHRFSGNSEAAFGWALTIARHILIDHYRSKASHPIDTQLVDEIEDGASDAESQLVAFEQIGQLLTDLQSLPEAQREMVVLRTMFGWRVNQIAAHLAMPENTVSVSLRRSFKRLQNLLTKHGVSYER